MKRFFFVLLAIFIYNKASCQTIISDLNGFTAIPINPSIILGDKKDTVGLASLYFSTGDSRISGSYFHYNPYKNRDFSKGSFVSVWASGAAKNSIANIFKSGDFAPEANARLYIGNQLDRSSGDNIDKPYYELWFPVVNFGFEGSKFKLFESDTLFGSQISKIQFTSLEANIGFNLYSFNFLKHQVLLGSMIGMRGSNNFNQLTESVREDTRVINDSATNTTRKIIIKETVYQGDYKENTAGRLSFDAYFVPQDYIFGYLIFTRTEFSKAFHPRHTVGGGLFFSKGDDAFVPNFAMKVSYYDISDSDFSDDDNANISKLNISLSTSLYISRKTATKKTP